MSSSATRRKRSLKNKTVLLGVSGSVAAYKTVDLVRRLKKEGADVSVVMTEAAKQFVTSLSLEVASQNKVYTSLFEEPMAHINLPSAADIFVIAPATAHVIAKFAHGLADDLLSTCLLSYSGKVIVAPSMNWRMYEDRIFQDNLAKIISHGAIQVGPVRGSLACGEEGIGRMAELSDIVDEIQNVLSKKDLENDIIIVTGGPTREYIDPVRFISNRSSGKMGISLARAARNRGAHVTLISGPSVIEPPVGIDLVQVETGEEMRNALKTKMKDATVLIMAAAVADFAPQQKYRTKIAKNGKFSLKLRQSADILSEISKIKRKPFIIGFAAETGKNFDRALEKMKKKNMDMIVFNDVNEPDAGFEVDTNRVVIIDKERKTGFDVMSKDSVADVILDRMVAVRA